LSFRVRQLRSAEFERWRDLRLRALQDWPNRANLQNQLEDEMALDLR
jgi:hypothetical protein